MTIPENTTRYSILLDNKIHAKAKKRAKKEGLKTYQWINNVLAKVTNMPIIYIKPDHKKPNRYVRKSKSIVKGSRRRTIPFNDAVYEKVHEEAKCKYKLKIYQYINFQLALELDLPLPTSISHSTKKRKKK